MGQQINSPDQFYFTQTLLSDRMMHQNVFLIVWPIRMRNNPIQYQMCDWPLFPNPASTYKVECGDVLNCY